MVKRARYAKPDQEGYRITSQSLYTIFINLKLFLMLDNHVVNVMLRLNHYFKNLKHFISLERRRQPVFMLG